MWLGSGPAPSIQSWTISQARSCSQAAATTAGCAGGARAVSPSDTAGRTLTEIVHKARRRQSAVRTTQLWQRQLMIEELLRAVTA